MDPKQTKLIKEIWLKNIVGKNFVLETSDLKEFLYKSLLSRNDEILEHLELNVPKESGVGFLKELVDSFSKITPNPLGFFPVGILMTGNLTCAGSAMLSNAILNNKGFKVLYGRPASHSVNIVKYESDYYWVDTTNGVLDTISVELEEKKTFSVAHIHTNNERIVYRVVPVFEPQEIIINVFGNMEALKIRNDKDTKVQKYLKDNRAVFDLDFNEIKDTLYKEYFDYVRYDHDFLLEQERISKCIGE